MKPTRSRPEESPVSLSKDGSEPERGAFKNNLFHSGYFFNSFYLMSGHKSSNHYILLTLSELFVMINSAEFLKIDFFKEKKRNEKSLDRGL